MAPKVILNAFAAIDADNDMSFFIPTVATKNIPPIVNKSAPSFLLNALNLSIFFSDRIFKN